MNKFLIFLTFITMLGFNAMAQDVILKQDSSEINVKVIEITDQQIKYKEFDFQDGPIRNINISDVSMITYENGRKEVFNKQTSTPTTPQKIYYEQPQKSYTMSSNNLKKEFDRIGDNDDKMLAFFKKNNFERYYNAFESACGQRNAGRILLALGIPITAGGILFVAINSNERDKNMTAGYVLMGVGEVLTIVSIPVSASAGARKRAIKNDFARKYFGISDYTYQPKLKFGQTTNGIGLTLNF
ncbi:MAG: hypothetical protein LBU83_03995 [Bacteroidales bacterium]|jgi:hypothetical protein|nr:hypothetical protein [Bacteroidales bacterium]